MVKLSIFGNEGTDSGMARNSKKNTQPEAMVEKHLVDKITNLGGIAWKFTSPGTIGVPDRLIIMNGLICFAELKRPKGGKVSDVQRWRIKQLASQGAKAYVIKTCEAADELVEHLMKGRLPDEI